jgi:large subunit ribosomal protein L13
MNIKTPATKQSQIQRTWHLIDVKDAVLGRVSPKIALLLRGKHKPYFIPHLDCGDYVVVVNAAQVAVTGKKEKQKKYRRYSGYPSGLKERTLRQVRERRPEELIRRAVSGMLPKNKLRDQWLSRLYVSVNEKHPYGSEFNKKD